MRKNFITGLALLIPTGLTFIVISFLINFLTAPFLKIFAKQLKNYTPPQEHLFFDSHALSLIAIQWLVFFVIVATILLMGMLARMMFFNYLFGLIDRLAYAIPGFNRLYKAIKEIIHTLFASEAPPFTHTVLVPFSGTEAYCLGLVSAQPQAERIAVFIPEAANLSTGFIVRYKKEELIYIDIPVEEALKTIYSCGTIFPDYRCIAPPADKELGDSCLNQKSILYPLPMCKRNCKP